MITTEIPTYWDLAYWCSSEYQTVKERLENEAEYNPPRGLLFAALGSVHYDAARVAIVGQDPYPRREHCTGVAFSTPPGVELPPTLVNIFKEYEDDLGYPAPKNGDLTRWCEQGVLLWNVYPSCATGKPGSHHWEEWGFLTQEIVEKLDKRVIPFVMLGREAQFFEKFTRLSPIIRTSHPSPMGVGYGFRGSKIFSRVNSELVKLGKEPINWRL